MIPISRPTALIAIIASFLASIILLNGWRYTK